MTTPSKRPRINLRQGLDRDVYAILKKLEDANDGKPFERISAVYDAIKRSNSSLSRHKKRPLEDAIDRVLQFRREELRDDEDNDSEAALEKPEDKPEDARFLLNRQMTKHWDVEPVKEADTRPQAESQPQSSENRATKKRRIQNDNEKRAGGNDAAATTPATTNGQADPGSQALTKSEKTPLKKSQKSTRYEVENPGEPKRLGGVRGLYDELFKKMRYALKSPVPSQQTGWRRVPGIVISGPSGIGKKSLVRSLAAKLEVPIVSIAGCFEDPERMEKSLNDAVDEAMRMAPCILFVEQLDWFMASSGGSGHTEHHRRIVMQFTRQMKRIEQDQPKDRRILAIATTSRITDIDPAVLKTGLFEQTVQMRVPDIEARKGILAVLTEDLPLAEDVDLVELVKMTHGFVGADIVRILTQAEVAAAMRTLDKQYSGEYPMMTDAPRPTTTDDMAMDGITDANADASSSLPPPLTLGDFKAVLKDFVPSLRKEGFTVIPNVTWSQVGALHNVREQLHMSIIGPIKDPDLYTRSGLGRPTGCLLWGPPGCGKTLVAQAVANEAQASFIVIKGPELLNKYVGESERAVRELFQRARASKPCIIFFDEMDALVPRRDAGSTEAGTRVVNALLTELDGTQDPTGVYVIGTTNRPDMIDAAMMRPGRLSLQLFLDMPTPAERVDILRAIYQTHHPKAGPEEMEGLAAVAMDARCTDFSGADLNGLRVKAAQNAVRRWQMGEKGSKGLTIDAEDWEKALGSTQRSVTNPETYRKLAKKLGGTE